MEKTFLIRTERPSDVMAYYRARTGLTKCEICKRLGIARPTLDKIEANPSNIAIKYIEKLGKIYGNDFVDYYMENKMYMS